MVGSMIALTSLALAPLVASLPFNTIGNAVVNNLCDTEVTLWTNGNSQQGLWNLQANSGYYSEPFAGSGIAIVLVKGHSDDPNGKYADVPKTTGLAFHPAHAARRFRDDHAACQFHFGLEIVARANRFDSRREARARGAEVGNVGDE